MVLVRHAEVHNRQNHKNKRLKRNHKNVENRPADLQKRSRQQPENSHTKQRSNQNKIISPAYMLPNNRSPKENGFASNPTTSINKLTGMNKG